MWHCSDDEFSAYLQHHRYRISINQLLRPVAAECFFYKQKTAYEMRMSDWSSDVCSSDLPARPRKRSAASGSIRGSMIRRRPVDRTRRSKMSTRSPHGLRAASSTPSGSGAPSCTNRPEEHTSELQSLLRTSYAVFCLTQNNNTLKDSQYDTTTVKSNTEHK